MFSELKTLSNVSTQRKLTLIHGLILIRRRQISHLLERYHLNLDLIPILRHQLLRVIRSVEVLASAVLPGPGVVTSDDEVSGTEVLADDGMPEGFAGPAHAHCEREEGEVAHSVRVARHNCLVDAYAAAGMMGSPVSVNFVAGGRYDTSNMGKKPDMNATRRDSRIVVHIPGLGKTHDGVNEHICLAIARCADGQFAVGTMHGVARLERDDFAPCEFLELSAELGWGDCLEVSEGSCLVASMKR